MNSSTRTLPLPLDPQSVITHVPNRTALEHDFPSVDLSQIASTESWRKEVHRPATSTHKWWAKRLGSLFRGIILSALSETAPQAMERVNTSPKLSDLVVLDPFAGSGITAVEVLKLGGRSANFDINPVATLVQRQAVAAWSLEKLQSLFSEIERKCKAQIDEVYRTEDGRTVLYYFWVASTSCPQCDAQVRLFDSTVFSKNAYPSRNPKAYCVCPECLDIRETTYDFELTECSNGHQIVPNGNVRGATMTCRNGHKSRIVDALNGQLPAYEMYAKIVLDESGKKSYEPISEFDRSLFQRCTTLLADNPVDNLLPIGELSAGNNTSQALRWNFREWADFFNPRQLYALSLLGSAIRVLG